MPNPYGEFDDAGREYVIHRPDTPLPWLNYLGQEQLIGLCTNTGGGFTFWRDARLRRLTRYRHNNVPLDLGGRYLYVNDGGTVWNPGWKPTKTAARPLRVPPRARLHEDPGRARRRRGRAALLRDPRRARRGVADDRPQHERRAEGAEALLLRRVLLLRSAERHDELPAHLLARRGRGRGLRDLPPHRVPRATRPLHAVRVHAGDGRLRHLARRVRRRAQRAPRGERPARGRLAGEHRARLEPDRVARAPPAARAGRLRDLLVPPRLRRPGRRAEVRAAGRPEQGEGPRPRRTARRARCGRRRLRSAPRDVGRAALELPGRLPGAEHPADAQRLEPVPVHDDVQPVALRQPLRDRDRARDGLPRLQPGPARLRPPDPRPRAASASSTWPRPSSPTAPATTSTSRSRRRGTPRSAATSTTTRCG